MAVFLAASGIAGVAGAVPAHAAEAAQAVTDAAAATPAATGLSYATGAGAGDEATITGSDLGTSPGTVLFGSAEATIVSWSDTSVVVIIPAGSGQVTVTLTTADGTAVTGAFIWIYGPQEILEPTSVSPAAGPAAGGGEATISGSGFGTVPGTVTVGGNAATVVAWTDTSIVIDVPAGTPGTVPIVLQTADEVASGISYTYEAVTAPAPTISQVAPGFGPATGGTRVTIDGSNFGTAQGTVTFGGANATIDSWSNTSIVLTSPTVSGPEEAGIVVTTAGGVASTQTIAFSYEATVTTPAPHVTRLSPASGATAGGERLTITGTNFGKTAGTVTVGGNAAHVLSWSSTSVAVMVPAGEPGPAPVVVTAGGSASNAVNFTYGNPSITRLSPDNGPAAGGTQLTISGSNFGAATGTVTVGKNAATVTKWTNTSVTVTVPAGSPGAAVVTLTANGQRSNPGIFTYDKVATSVATSVRLSASVNPVSSSGKVTFSATVTAASGRSTPTGSIQFTVNGKALGSAVTLVNGRATSAAVSSLSPGSHTVVATYVPGTGFEASKASLTETALAPTGPGRHRAPGRGLFR